MSSLPFRPFGLVCLLLASIQIAAQQSKGQCQSTLPVAFLRGLRGGDQSDSTIPAGNRFQYEVLEENILYSRWRILYQRLVRMPNGKVIDFDVVGQKGAGTAIIFAWDSSTKTATLCREYNPGPNQALCGLAAGVIEDKHDSDPRMAAEHELEEELHLSGGTWLSLLESPMAMDKYATTMIHPYLVIDAHHVTNPRPLDDEEDIEILSNVSVEEIMRIIRRGDMNVVASWAALLAMEKLREMGEIE
jgi:hypothetical protein